VVEPLLKELERPLRVLDLGAGNGWLSHQLALQDHDVTAVDLLVNQFDGLGAHVHYATEYVPVQAEYDHLPIDGQKVDLLVFNGSVHYSTDYHRTFGEGLRVLQPKGRFVVMDTPIYHDPSSGIEMVRERQLSFAKRYNINRPPLESQNFLTFDQLSDLSASLGVTWTYLKPEYGLRWAVRSWRARLRGSREPATFLVIVGRRK
jgi:SAM-dependent methyltransferase